MNAGKLTFYHRGKTHPEHSLGGYKQETTCPYFSKTYSARGKLLMRLELSPHQGNRNTEKRPNPQTEATPKAN